MRATFDFPDLPTSTRPFRGWAAVYVKPPRTSLDFATAPEWAHPTALDFEQTAMDAQKFAAQITYDNENMPIHPVELMYGLEDMWRGIKHNMSRDGYVIDAGERVGVYVEEEFNTERTAFRFKAKCWPAIPGVTTPDPDRDSTI